MSNSVSAFGKVDFMTVIPVHKETKAILERISQERGISLEEAMRRAVEMYWYKEMLEAANAAYAKMREDSSVSKEFDEETKASDFTLLDGLKNM
jgi:hypothetical protein